MAENLLFNTALSRAMHLCAEREWCNYDMKQKLISWGVGADETEKILIVLSNEKFIDELRYASALTKARFRYNKWGRIKISSALRAKKIPDSIIKRALETLDEKEYFDLLKSIIEKQRKTVKAKNQYDLKGKLLRHCLSKGFESNFVYDLLNIEE